MRRRVTTLTTANFAILYIQFNPQFALNTQIKPQPQKMHVGSKNTALMYCKTSRHMINFEELIFSDKIASNIESRFSIYIIHHYKYLLD